MDNFAKNEIQIIIYHAPERHCWRNDEWQEIVA